MKKLLGIAIVFCLMSLSGMAQSKKSARINLYNGAVGNNADLNVTADGDNQTIRVRSRRWTVIETTDDSLGFVINGKPYFVQLEPMKSYYFIAQRSQFSYVIVTEETERAFLMTVSVNSVVGPEEYKLGKQAN